MSGIFVSLCTGLDMQTELDRLLPEITFAFRKLKMSNTLPYLKKKKKIQLMKCSLYPCQVNTTYCFREKCNHLFPGTHLSR